MKPAPPVTMYILADFLHENLPLESRFARKSLRLPIYIDTRSSSRHPELRLPVTSEDRLTSGVALRKRATADISSRLHPPIRSPEVVSLLTL
jgi:hypothetical protein